MYFSRGRRHFSFADLRMLRFGDCKESGLEKGQRHELIGVHGYDIKAAMHVIRLLNEGIELMRSGTITLPRPEKELLITIRTGNYGSLERVLTLANTLFTELESAEPQSQLPERVDRIKVSTIVSQTYLEFWNRERQVDDTHPHASQQIRDHSRQ